MELDKILGAIASRLQIDADEFIASLKEGENWKEDAVETVGTIISDHIKSAKDQQHKRGTREYEDRIVKHIKAQGFSNPEGKKGTELIEAYQEWVKAQAIDDDGTGGKKPAELTEAELMKLPAFKTALAAKLQAAQQEVDAVRAEFETYKGKEARKTVEQIADQKMLEILTAKNAVLESEALGVTKDERLAKFKKMLPYDRMRLSEDGKEIIMLDEDGEPLQNNLGKPITYESVVLSEWGPAFGFHKQDPKKGGPTPGLRDKTKEGEGAMRFDSADDFNKYISSEPDATKRFEAQKAYLAQTEGEGGE